jgi:hypothetical protein
MKLASVRFVSAVFLLHVLGSSILSRAIAQESFVSIVVASVQTEAVPQHKHFIGHRGGAQIFKAKPPQSSSPSGKLGEKLSPLAEKFVECTLYSKEHQPQSIGHAEWKGFLSGWMLVVLPIPLPILMVAIVLNTILLLKSKWNSIIKRNYLIGFSHGIMVLVILLRELESKKTRQSEGVSARVALTGLNLATSLLFGNAGGYLITKRFMDIAISVTLVYILLHYFR